MNPTARNISAHQSWNGIQAPWLGIKTVWNMFAKIGVFDQKLADKINSMNIDEWAEDFAKSVYNIVQEHSVYITNLSKQQS